MEKLVNMIQNFELFSQAGKDVVACLNEAMERLGLEMRVSALVWFSSQLSKWNLFWNKRPSVYDFLDPFV